MFLKAACYKTHLQSRTFRIGNAHLREVRTLDSCFIQCAKQLGYPDVPLHFIAGGHFFTAALFRNLSGDYPQTLIIVSNEYFT